MLDARTGLVPNHLCLIEQQHQSALAVPDDALDGVEERPREILVGRYGAGLVGHLELAPTNAQRAGFAGCGSQRALQSLHAGDLLAGGLQRGAQRFGDLGIPVLTGLKLYERASPVHRLSLDPVLAEQDGLADAAKASEPHIRGLLGCCPQDGPETSDRLVSPSEIKGLRADAGTEGILAQRLRHYKHNLSIAKTYNSSVMTASSGVTHVDRLIASAGAFSRHR